MSHNNETTAVQPVTPELVSYLRQKNAIELLNRFSELIFWIHHQDSGKVIEAVVQYLSEDEFNALSALVIGYDFDDLVVEFASSVIVRLASKQQIQDIDYDQYINAAKNFLCLIEAEQNRRAGRIDYVFPANVFQNFNKLQFITITPEFKSNMITEMLKKFETAVTQ
jgi:hypothetical protein